MRGFFAELRRRNVIKVAIVYVVSGWLMLQAGDVLFELLLLPAWTKRLVLAVLLLGFPVVLVFSWIYELTPEGIKREKDVDPTRSITRQTGRRINAAIIVGLALAIGLMLYHHFAPPEATVPAEPGAVVRPTESPAERQRDPSPSIAVLPFANMSDDPRQEHFADGLADTLMHVLVQVRGLQVAARTSSFAFKGRAVNVAEIASELGVGTILEGSVQKSGNRIRVIAQLIDATTGSHLWSANFDRELDDIFAIQDEIAAAVVGALELTLLEAETTRLAQRYQPTLEAYEQLILGRQQVENRTATSLAAAEEHFRRAIELDPTYSLAYTDLADAIYLQWAYADVLMEDAQERRKPLIDRALELDPRSGEAHTSKAKWLEIRFEFDAAAEAYQRAIELAPGYARAYHWYFGLKYQQNQFDEALPLIRKALELDPMSPIIRAGYGQVLWSLGRVEEAMFALREGIRRNPEFPNYYLNMSEMLEALGRLGEARRWQQEVIRLNPEGMGPRARDCTLRLVLGDAVGAQSCLDSLAASQPDHFRVMSVQIAIYDFQNRPDELARLLGRVAEKFPATPQMRSLVNAAYGYVHAHLREFDTALGYYEQAYPALFSDPESAVDVQNWQDALWLAWIMREQGRDAFSERLLTGIEPILATRHRTRGQGYGIADVVILTIRGDREGALTRLREAIDEGWRTGWRSALDDVRLSAIADDPRYAAMVAEVEADILAQRLWYEANKDAPLL